MSDNPVLKESVFLKLRGQYFSKSSIYVSLIWIFKASVLFNKIFQNAEI